MEQLIELLTQIQDLAGMGIEALQQAGTEGAAPESAPEGEAGPPAEQPPA